MRGYTIIICGFVYISSLPINLYHSLGSVSSAACDHPLSHPFISFSAPHRKYLICEHGIMYVEMASGLWD